MGEDKFQTVVGRWQEPATPFLVADCSHTMAEKHLEELPSAPGLEMSRELQTGSPSS